MTEAGIESLVRQLADGRFHSGENLARLLGVSRTAVWKRIRKISRDTGLDIHAVRGKGYRLALPLELLDADRIAGHISSGSSVEVEVEVHPSLPSTSSHLAERLGELPDNTLCFAEHQTAGRGRRGRQWVSPYGSNLYFSIYRRFPLGMHELSGLSLAVGAVVAETLGHYVDGISLKWPNDLVLNGGEHFDAAAVLARRIIEPLLGERPLPGSTILNVNIPDRPLAEIEGLRATRLGFRHKAEPAIRAVDPNGSANRRRNQWF